MTIYKEDVSFSRASGATRVNEFGLIVGVDFSTTSNTFGTGAKTFTLAADANVNRDWPVGSKVRATSQAAPLGLMNGTVTSYDPATQSLVIEVTESTGTGTATNWRIGNLEFRRDFDPVTLAPKGGLVEGGVTNGFLYSQDFTNAYWSKNGGSVGTKILSPDGSLNADVFVPTAGTALHSINRAVVGSNGVPRTYMFAFKNVANARYVTIGSSNSASSNAAFDLDSLQVIQPTLQASGTSHILDIGNGWRLCVYQTIAGTTVNILPTPIFEQWGATSLTTLAGTEQLGIWGGMFIDQVAVQRTSYIPTNGVAVSRAADLLSVTGSNFTQAYNQSQGTLLVECIPTEQLTSSTIASINDGTLNNEIRVGQKQTGTRSSIRAIASDGITDVMGLDGTGNNIVRSNGVDYAEVNTGIAATMLGVANNGSQFLAAGSSGAFASGEGTTFVQRSIERDHLNGAHFGIGRFVIGAVASDGIGSVRVSTDGKTFRRINIAGLTQTINAVTSNGTNQYVAVGVGGVIYTSPNAETWTARVSGTTSPFNSVHFFGGRYVIATIGTGASRYSDDGVNWTSIAGISLLAQDVCHNGTDLWVSVGNNGVIFSSPDGITWTQQTNPVSANLRGIHFADGLWVAVGDDGTVVTSPDGITWTDRTATSGTVNTINEVGFFNGEFYFVGNITGGAVFLNTAAGIVAGTTWTSRLTIGANIYNGIATNGSRLLICGSSGAIATSDDGTTFTSRTGNNATLNGAAFGNGTYVVVGNVVNGSGLIATVDPVTFAYHRRVSGVVGNITNVRRLNGVFVASAVSNYLYSDASGQNWTAESIASTQNDVGFDGTYYILLRNIGGNIFYLTSLGGAQTLVTGIGGQPFNSIISANGITVVVGFAGAIYTKPNGVIPTTENWTLRTSGTTAHLRAVHYSTRDQQWYAAGDNGTILRSSDAITWESIANDAVGAVVSNGVVSVNPIAAKIIPNKRNRIALSWSSEGASLSVNGSVATLDPSLVMPIVDRITIGRSGDSSNFLNAPFKVLKTYRVKVSDSELQAITRI